MIDAAGASEVRYFYHYDGLGSVIALSNIDGDIVEAYSYDVYGTPTIYTDAGVDGIWRTSDDVTDDESAIGNPYMFTGRRYDAESGLYYYRARMYSPAIGRFLQTDPLEYWDSMNLYQYCLNNPVNLIDPLGLFFSSKGIVGAVMMVIGGGLCATPLWPIGAPMFVGGAVLVIWDVYDMFKDDGSAEKVIDKQIGKEVDRWNEENKKIHQDEDFDIDLYPNRPSKDPNKLSKDKCK